MIDFSLVDAIDADSIGLPGERTFRLRIRAGENRAALWMEKEQLSEIGRALSQILAEHSQARGRAESAPAEMGEFSEPDVDFRIARLGLDFQPEDEHIVLLADDREALESGGTPAFRMEITRAMALSLIEAIPSIVGAGRPLCPLCGRPLEGEGQHFCPPSNGHSTDEPLPSAEDQPQ